VEGGLDSVKTNISLQIQEMRHFVDTRAADDLQRWLAFIKETENRTESRHKDDIRQVLERLTEREKHTEEVLKDLKKQEEKNEAARGETRDLWTSIRTWRELLTMIGILGALIFGIWKLVGGK